MLVCYKIPLTEDASPPPSQSWILLLLLLVTRLRAVGTVAPAPVVPAVAPAPVPTLEQKMNLGSPDQKESFSPFGRRSCSLSAPSCPCFCSCCDPCTIKFGGRAGNVRKIIVLKGHVWNWHAALFTWEDCRPRRTSSPGSWCSLC